MAKNTMAPSLFTYDDGTLCMTFDLAAVVLISKRPNGGGYYVNLGGQSIPVPTEVADALTPALVAFKGKFIPGQTT